jgi:formiminotetrahydrofolate cyclodeaminase
MVSSFLEQLRQPRPFPGGGSAAAHVGALALALVEKVIRIEINASELGTHTSIAWNGRLSRVIDLSARFGILIQEDGRVYARMSRVRAQGSEVDVIVEAVKEAVVAPVCIIQTSIEGLELISESVKQCREYLVPDLLVAVELLEAVARGAEAIATANVALLKSPTHRTEFLDIITRAVKDVSDLYAKVKSL